MKKRVVSWLLVVLMLTSMLPTGVWAEDVYRSSEDTGRYGVSTLASTADAELEGFFDEWEGIATVANAAARGFVRDGEELKSGNSSASSTRSTLTVTMLKAAELSFDYRLKRPQPERHGGEERQQDAVYVQQLRQQRGRDRQRDGQRHGHRAGQRR